MMNRARFARQPKGNTALAQAVTAENAAFVGPRPARRRARRMATVSSASPSAALAGGDGGGSCGYEFRSGCEQCGYGCEL